MSAYCQLTFFLTNERNCCLSLPLCTIVCAPKCMMWLYDQSWEVFLKHCLPFPPLSLEAGSFIDPEITNWPLLDRSVNSKEPLTPNSPACYTWPYVGCGDRTKVRTLARRALHCLGCLPDMFFLFSFSFLLVCFGVFFHIFSWFFL